MLVCGRTKGKPTHPSVTCLLARCSQTTDKGVAQKNREYYLKNKEHIAQVRKAHYQSNKEKITQYNKLYNQKKFLRRYRLLHKEDRSRYIAEYNKQHREKLKEQLQARKEKYRDQFLSSVPKHKKRLEEALHIKAPEDWYKVSLNQLEPHITGIKVTRYFTLMELVQMMYPDVDWILGNFTKVPKDTWADPEKLREYMLYIQKELFIEREEDWYRLSREMVLPVLFVLCFLFFFFFFFVLYLFRSDLTFQLQSFGAGGMLATFGSLHSALLFAFPEVLWDPKKFSDKRKMTNQWWLLVNLRKMFEGEEILENYLHPNLVWESKENPGKMELDLWIPSRNIAFEYQGEQHYHDFVQIFGRGADLYSYYLRDQEKKNQCAAEGISLIYVPYWWDMSSSSLQEIIVHQTEELE
eukprot:TRINITY_DN1244_c0_g2_i10.p1 TRINITY_DN1244_c0_g2~~TRINITY_DN1244_c0_g2_i10.p1  ORF type:complete len:410 (+),score=78.71 TRINITY_DN1244_c0_g2_i10:545-1774(+)